MISSSTNRKTCKLRFAATTVSAFLALAALSACSSLNHQHENHHANDASLHLTTKQQIAMQAGAGLGYQTTGRSIVLSDISFEPEKSEIKPEAQTIVNQAALYLAQNPHLKAFIEGHADLSGNAFDNQILSVLRARAVKKGLESRGIARSRLVTDGLGVTRPIATNKTYAGRSTNRRVEITFRE